MARETAPIPILYSTTLPYASLGREAVDCTLAAASEVNASTDDTFRLEPKIADLSGHPEQYASLADAAIRQQWLSPCDRQDHIVKQQGCPAGHGTT